MESAAVGDPYILHPRMSRIEHDVHVFRDDNGRRNQRQIVGGCEPIVSDLAKCTHRIVSRKQILEFFRQNESYPAIIRNADLNGLVIRDRFSLRGREMQVGLENAERQSFAGIDDATAR